MKKQTRIFAGLIALFSFTLMSCASTAHIEKDDSIDFGKYKTFAWIENAASDSSKERSTVEKNDPVYSRSYTRTFYNPRAGRYFNVYYPSRFIGYDNYGVQVQEGTVTISMIDTKTDKTVWQGWTTEQIDSRKIKTKEVESAIKSIFKKFDLAKN